MNGAVPVCEIEKIVTGTPRCWRREAWRREPTPLSLVFCHGEGIADRYQVPKFDVLAFGDDEVAVATMLAPAGTEVFRVAGKLPKLPR